MSYFPIVKFPEEIEQVISAYPPKFPFTEILPIQSGEKPQKLNFTLIFIESILVFVVVPVIFKSIPTFVVFLFIIAIGAIAIQAWLQYESYPNRLHVYKNKVENYNRELSKYKERKYKHEEEQKIAQSSERVAQWRREQILKILKYTIPHDGNRSSATKGFSEEKFRSYLNQYFSNKIHVGLTLKFSDSYHPYSPDFTYIDSEINLYIDIEIDEPYVWNTGKPTHFWGAYKDDRRNNFFNDNYWTVIRFSEQQVVCYPHSCCKTVAHIIAQITQDDLILNQFTNIPDLQQQKQWREAEAIEMAQRRERDDYQSTSNNLNISSQNKAKFVEPANNINISNSEKITINNEQAKKRIRRRFKKYLKDNNLKRNKNVKKQFIGYLKMGDSIELVNWLKKKGNCNRAMSYIANIGQESN